jgi:hypothetical protein
MEIKTVPYVPLSHPFVERLVGTLKRECLDRTVFWTADLEAKLREFQKYFNEHRTHAGLEGRLPDSGAPGSPTGLASNRWRVLLIVGSLAVVAAVLAMGLSQSRRIDDLLLTVYAPLSPLILWFIKEERKHREGKELSERVHTLANDLWQQVLENKKDADKAALRDLQNAIFSRRRTAPMVPTLLHKFQQKRYQRDMEKITKDKIQKAPRI